MRIFFKILYFGALACVLNIGYSSVGFADDKTVNLETFGSASPENRISEHTDDYIEYLGNGWYYVQSQGTKGAWLTVDPSFEQEMRDWIPDNPKENVFYIGVKVD